MALVCDVTTLALTEIQHCRKYAHFKFARQWFFFAPKKSISDKFIIVLKQQHPGWRTIIFFPIVPSKVRRRCVVIFPAEVELYKIIVG